MLLCRKRRDVGMKRRTILRPRWYAIAEWTADIPSIQVYEPLLVVGLDKFAGLDIRVRVSGGGHTSQV